ncbi:hypothetical protein DPMN_171454 [Dreissena polymorpha]|uniref:Uncharacterized protein n=1 Tax=Dreissena polymorpha TaxID=45954 RepID=A0A9D4E0C9_DREPO|nr:hypothetical protein DPMN_171454 [Dreissena polymorpha]
MDEYREGCHTPVVTQGCMLSVCLTGGDDMNDTVQDIDTTVSARMFESLFPCEH